MSAELLSPDYDPMKDEGEFMNPTMLEYFKLKLLDWRSELLRESSETIKNSLQEEHLQKPDMTDRASAETDHALELRTRDRERKLVKKLIRRYNVLKMMNMVIAKKPVIRFQLVVWMRVLLQQ